MQGIFIRFNIIHKFDFPFCLFIFFDLAIICCYILWSEKLGKFYIGACQDSLQERIKKHIMGFYDGINFTKKANDWSIYLRIDAVE
ncbi:MAG: GIY-YIG nuclease family protein [Cytophagaceae bacterium]|nr:GIY-YIG nuclease family protein [Cytophagaceae bacterium]